MSNTISNAVQTLTDKIVSGSLTPQESAQISVAINQLTTGANVESALVAVAEQHLNTATQSLGHSTTELESAKNTFAQQATTELAKIPELIDSIERSTQKTYNFSVSPVTAIQNIGPTVSAGYISVKSYKAPNLVSIEDFDSGELYFYYDRGRITWDSSASWHGAIARLGVIKSDGSMQVVSRRVKLTENSKAYGLTPYFDGTARLLSSTGSVNQASPHTITIYKAVDWSTDTSIAVDFGALKVRKSDRALIYVDGGKAYALNGQGRKDLGISVANIGEFNTKFTVQQGYSAVVMSYYSHSNATLGSTNPNLSHVSSLPPLYLWDNKQYEFSKAKGLVPSAGIKVDLYGESVLPYYSSTNHAYSAFSRYSGQALLQASAHSPERMVNCSMAYRRKGSEGSFTQYNCHVLAISRQQSKILYIGSSNMETTEGIAQAL